jgi:hypothetical protein
MLSDTRVLVVNAVGPQQKSLQLPDRTAARYSSLHAKHACRMCP